MIIYQCVLLPWFQFKEVIGTVRLLFTSVLLPWLQDKEDPFYLVDLGRLLDLYDLWREALPTVHPFYAVKCNSDPALLHVLAALGCGFDCASKVSWVCV